MKLDLYTHCFEAICILSPELITPSVVSKIITSVKSKGLDGIAITEHYDNRFGFVAQKIVSEHFDNQIVVIPGHEVYSHGYHLVELFLPGNTVFRFLPHPTYAELLERNYDFSKVHGIEIGNYAYDHSIDKPRIRSIAEKYNLLLLSNSDAHDLNDIGRHYNEVDLDDLINRVWSSTEDEVKNY